MAKPSKRSDDLVSEITSAFSEVAPPSELTNSLQLSDSEFAEVSAFEALDWKAITFDLVDQNGDAIFWFSPEAFHFYLPGFLLAGLKSDRFDCTCYDALITMLDRSPEEANWDDFFRPRWRRLNSAQIEAVTAWMEHFASRAPDAFHEGSLQRIQDTLELLKLIREEL